MALDLPELADAASTLEQRFLVLLQERGLPMPEVNARVGRFRVDCLWRTQGVIVELDGHAFHANAATAERDRQRDVELRAAGFIVLRYTWHQVTRQPDQVVADLGGALASPYLPRKVVS